MHMMSKKELSSKAMDTVKRSRNPTIVWTASGEVHTHEEAQVFVHDLNQFVTVYLLEEKPAVQQLGKLCKDHLCSYDWVSGQGPRLTIHGKSILCKTDNFVPLVVPRLSTNPGNFVLYIAITSLVEKRRRTSQWKQGCIKLIFRFSV